MLSFILSFIAFAAIQFGLPRVWPDHYGWTITFAVLAFVVIWVLVNILVGKKLAKVFRDVQSALMSSQESLQREMMFYQQKGMVGPTLQAKVMEKMKTNVLNAIAMMDAAKPLAKWSFLVNKQICTMKAQLFYQIKDFENADKYLDKALAFDPMILAMQMARAYKRDDMKRVKKLYAIGTKRFRGAKAVILYALYSWILVKQEKLEEAVVVLDEGRKRTDNEVLTANWEHLANGRTKKYSNANLGESWYALMLEEPKQIRMQQPRQQYMR